MAVDKFWVEITENSYSVENNTSNVTVKVKITVSGASYNELSPSGTIKWGGLWAGSADTSFTHGFKKNATTTLYSGTWDVKHNADGTGKVSADVSFNTGISAGTVTASKTLTLTTIARKAILTDAPNFTDISSPTITYSNPLGNKVELAAAISSDQKKADLAAYRAIDKAGTSYTFEFTNEERAKLQQICANDKSVTVWFYVRTDYNGEYYYSKLAKTLTIAGAEDGPTLNPTVTDVNGTTANLTGSASTRFVKGHSNAQFSVGATAIGGASIVSQGVTCGGQRVDGATGTINAVESATFEFYATDSRGYTRTATIERELVDYVPLTCVAKTSIPTGEGRMTLTVEGNFFDDYFDSAKRKANSLTVKYVLDGGTPQSLPVTTSGENTYSKSIELQVDYQTAHAVEVTATDSLMTAVSKPPTVKATPVFDWGENIFTHNTPVEFNGLVTFNGGINANGSELPDGGSGSGSSNISLPLAVSDGGTGATTAAKARTNLDVYSKSEVDSKVSSSGGGNVASHTHAASDITSGTIAVARGGTGATTVAAARTSLDVYSKAEVDNKISNAGGGGGSNIDLPLAVASGGTGATSAADARKNLGVGKTSTLFWSTNDKYQKLDVTQVGSGSFIPSGHKAQGMATDGTYLYMMSHASDTSATYITKINISTGKQASQTTISNLKGHCNSMVYYNNKLYVTAASGTDYGKLGIIPVNNMTNFSIIDAPHDLWDFVVVNTGSSVFAAGLIADTHEWVVFAQPQSGKAMRPVRRFTGWDGSGIIQGCHGDKDYLYNVFAYDSGNWGGQNILAVMEWDGFVRRVFWINGGNTEEFEDVCVPKGYNGDIYFNDIAGNLWKGTLSNRLKNEYYTKIDNPWKTTPVQNVYQYENGTEVNVGTVTKSFYAHPYVYKSAVSDMVGAVYVHKYRFPLSYNPTTMTINCYGMYFNGSKQVAFSLVWGLDDSLTNESYAWTMTDASWLYDVAAAKTYSGPSSISSCGLADYVYVDHVTALSGISPEGSISI